MIQICGWEKHQHYKNNKPAWIKVYRDVLGNYEIMFQLKPEERWIVIGLWLLAAETNNKINDDLAYLKERLRCKVTMEQLELMQTLDIITLVDVSREGLEGVYSDPREGLALEEKRREEKRREETFEIWWNKYNKKRGRDKVESKWLKLKEEEMQLCLDSVDAYVESTPEKQFRKDPLTYLNGKHWGDDVIQPEATKPVQVSRKCAECGKPWISGMDKCGCGGKFVKGA